MDMFGIVKPKFSRVFVSGLVILTLLFAVACGSAAAGKHGSGSRGS